MNIKREKNVKGHWECKKARDYGCWLQKDVLSRPVDKENEGTLAQIYRKFQDDSSRGWNQVWGRLSIWLMKSVWVTAELLVQGQSNCAWKSFSGRINNKKDYSGNNTEKKFLYLQDLVPKKLALALCMLSHVLFKKWLLRYWEPKCLWEHRQRGLGCAYTRFSQVSMFMATFGVSSQSVNYWKQATSSFPWKATSRNSCQFSGGLSLSLEKRWFWPSRKPQTDTHFV